MYNRHISIILIIINSITFILTLLPDSKYDQKLLSNKPVHLFKNWENLNIKSTLPTSSCYLSNTLHLFFSDESGTIHYIKHSTNGWSEQASLDASIKSYSNLACVSGTKQLALFYIDKDSKEFSHTIFKDNVWSTPAKQNKLTSSYFTFIQNSNDAHFFYYSNESKSILTADYLGEFDLLTDWRTALNIQDSISFISGCKTGVNTLEIYWKDYNENVFTSNDRLGGIWSDPVKLDIKYLGDAICSSAYDDDNLDLFYINADEYLSYISLVDNIWNDEVIIAKPDVKLNKIDNIMKGNIFAKSGEGVFYLSYEVIDNQNSEDGLIWLWILIGLILFIVITLLIVYRNNIWNKLFGDNSNPLLQ